MTTLSKSDIETICLDRLHQQRYEYTWPEKEERNGLAEVLLRNRLQSTTKN